MVLILKNTVIYNQIIKIKQNKTARSSLQISLFSIKIIIFKIKSLNFLLYLMDFIGEAVDFLQNPMKQYF